MWVAAQYSVIIHLELYVATNMQLFIIMCIVYCTLLWIVLYVQYLQV